MSPSAFKGKGRKRLCELIRNVTELGVYLTKENNQSMWQPFLSLMTTVSRWPFLSGHHMHISYICLLAAECSWLVNYVVFNDQEHRKQPGDGNIPRRLWSPWRPNINDFRQNYQSLLDQGGQKVLLKTTVYRVMVGYPPDHCHGW